MLIVCCWLLATNGVATNAQLWVSYITVLWRLNCMCKCANNSMDLKVPKGLSCLQTVLSFQFQFQIPLFLPLFPFVSSFCRWCDDNGNAVMSDCCLTCVLICQQRLREAAPLSVYVCYEKVYSLKSAARGIVQGGKQGRGGAGVERKQQWKCVLSIS